MVGKSRSAREKFVKYLVKPRSARHEHPHGPQAVRPGPRSLPLAIYRTFVLRAPLRLTWQQVYRQFGLHPDKASDKNTVQMFRRNILRELKKIKLAWPGLNYTIAPGLLILHPSRPAIPPADQGQLPS